MWASTATPILAEARRADEARADLRASTPSFACRPMRSTTCTCRRRCWTRRRRRSATSPRPAPDLAPVLLVGAPLRQGGRLYNCAVAMSRGARSWAWCRSRYLPNYREYYEKRWFAHGRGVGGREIAVAGREAPFGADLIFEAQRPARLRLPHRDLRGLLGADPALLRRRAGRRDDPDEPVGLEHRHRQVATSGTCSAARSRRAPSPPMPIPPPGRARARPTWPGTGRARSTSWAT